MSYRCSITKKVVHGHKRCLLITERVVGGGRREIESEKPISPDVWREYHEGDRRLDDLQRLEPPLLVDGRKKKKDTEIRTPKFHSYHT